MIKRYLKLFLVATFSLLLTTGCTSKEQVSAVPYITLNENSNDSLKVMIGNIEDKRESKFVAIVVNDEKIEDKYELNIDPKIWYKDSIIRELKASKIYHEKGEISLSVNILEIEAIYKKYSLDKKNLSVKLVLEVKVKKGDTTHSANINLSQTTYRPVILDASSFDDIVNEILRDSVSKVVTLAIKKLS